MQNWKANCSRITRYTDKLKHTVNSTLTDDNNKVQFGSEDQAQRVVPEVLVVEKSLILSFFQIYFCLVDEFLTNLYEWREDRYDLLIFWRGFLELFELRQLDFRNEFIWFILLWNMKWGSLSRIEMEKLIERKKRRVCLPERSSFYSRDNEGLHKEME